MPTSAGPGQPRRGPGRPPKPPADSASALAQLGGLVRRIRGERGLTLMSLGELTGYSWQHLGAVERGQVVPSEAVVAACERVLTAGGQLVALFPAVVREQASRRHGKEAARRADATRTDPDVDWARLGAAARRPSAVTVTLVEKLEEITDRQRVLYHALSSAEILIPVEAHLSLLASLLRGYQPEPLRRRIASAAAEAAGFAAWLWFDLGDQFKMGALYEMADDLSQEAGNPALAAYITGYRALATEARGLDREAVRQAEAARDRAPAGTSQLARSWLSAVGANTLALTGDRSSALNLLGEASDQLDAAQGREEWMYDFDRSALAAYQGQCHLRLGQPREATAAFEAGLASLPRGCDRRGAFLAIGLAEACLSERMLDAAVHHAQRALSVFATAGSLAGLRRVQRCRGLLADAGFDREASDLDQQVRDHLAAIT
jgi:tetratricopeptide (TPR) repeat protein